VPVAKPSIRLDLLTTKEAPAEPLAVDVRDAQGRLVLKAGETVTMPLLDRLRKMGILEIFVANREANGSEYWNRWGEEWLKEVFDRLILLAPEGGAPDEALVRFRKVLSDAVSEFVRKKSLEPGR